MSYCPKCGTKVREEMNFCPKCGASLKVAQPTAEAAPPAPIRVEKAERREKEEKGEKPEKAETKVRYEKREFTYVGPLIGGLFLMFIGFIFYLVVTGSLRWEAVGAIFFIVVGIMIVVGVAYAAMIAARRHPQT